MNEAKKIEYDLIRKGALKQILLKNNDILLQLLHDIICYDYELVNKFVALPMEYLNDEMWEYVEQESLIDLIEAVCGGDFNPYDDFFIMDEHECLISFTKKEYLEYIRENSRLDRIINVAFNEIPQDFLTYDLKGM